MSGIAVVRLIFVIAIIGFGLLLLYVGVLEAFIAGFQPVVVEHGMGRAMNGREIAAHAFRAIVLFLGAAVAAWASVKVARGKRGLVRAA